MIADIDMYGYYFGVEPICRVLGATASEFTSCRGYKASKSRPVRNRQIHPEKYGAYGKWEMWHPMRQKGWDIGQDTKRHTSSRLTG
jgi:hypothetical protein